MTEASECFTKEILADGIIIYRIQISTSECADFWFEDISAEFARAKIEKRNSRLLYDLRNMTKATPYTLERMQQLASLSELPEKWFVASVTGNAFVTGVVKFIKSISLDPKLDQYSQIFDDEVKALEWLRSQ
jgi:hypothetical protein